MEQMNWQQFWDALIARVQSGLAVQVLPASIWLPFAVAGAAIVVFVGPFWRLVRTVVTVVHELGHALVGLLCGRKFTGLVINSDMSGHTVTSGRARGLGLILTTAAGYPMPLLVGAGVCAAALTGRAGLVLLIALVLVLFALVRARSLFTVVSLLAVFAGCWATWWFGQAVVQAAVICGIGLVLIMGGWRQLAAVIRQGGPGQDPGVLARLTPLPTLFWQLVFVLIAGASTVWTAALFVPYLPS